GDGPTEGDGGAWFLAGGALAVEVAVAAEAQDLVAGVVAHRHRVGDGVGDEKPAVVVDIEARFGADAGAAGLPLADRPAAGVLCEGADPAGDSVVAPLELTAGRRELVDRADGAAVSLVLLEAGGNGVVGRQPALEQVDVAGAVDPQAAA